MSKMKPYWQGLTAKEKKDLADRCGTTVDYLRQIVGGHRKAGTDLAKKLDTESNGSWSRTVSRPDVWLPDDLSRAATE